MNKTLFTLAVVSAFAAGSAFATDPMALEDFETGFNVGDAITTATYWSADGDDQSVIAGDSSNKYLDLKTEGSTLTRDLENASVANDAIAAGDTVVFESEIKFVPSDKDDCDLTGGTNDVKFALFAYAPDGGSTTNLVVFHKIGDDSYTNEVITVGGAIDPDAYTKVTVKVFAAGEDGVDGLFFTVALNDDEPLAHAPNTYNDPQQFGYDVTWFKTVNDEDDDDNKEFSAICFKGTGAVDNISVTTEAAAGGDDWAADPTEVAGQTAAEAYPSLDNTALASADAEALTTWALANNIAFSDATTDPADYVDAFLLNCDPTDVDDEAEEFVATITIDGNGDIVVTPPDGKTYNVTPQLKGKASLTDADWDDLGDYDTADTTGYQFFMLELSL